MIRIVNDDWLRGGIDVDYGTMWILSLLYKLP